MSRKTSRVPLVVLSALAIAVLAGWVALAGELEPPVPPGTPTMKPLNEVEPRRPIYAGMLPLTIDEEGSSWYLAESISVLVGGITVAAQRVTIDLMGFTLAGFSGNGPAISSIYSGTTVHNGTIYGWDQGVKLGSSSTVRNILVYQPAFDCIVLGYDSSVTDSMALNCGRHGIVVDAGTIVHGCVASNNTENGIWSTWIDAGWTVIQGSLISGNIVDANDRNGIRVDGHATVLNNQVRASDETGFEGKAGIWVYGEGNRIEGNHIAANNIGIDLDGNDNIIIKNTLVHNLTAAYDVAPGTIGNVFEIGTGPSAGPWANFCKGTGCPP